MHPINHRSNTARLGPPPGTPEGNVQTLAVTRIMIGSKRQGDFPPALEAPGPIVRSYWRPTDLELRALLKGRALVFQCWGYSHPPVFIGVEGDGPLDLVGVPFPDPDPSTARHQDDPTGVVFRIGCLSDEPEDGKWEAVPGKGMASAAPGTVMRPSEFRAARGDLFGVSDSADALAYGIAAQNGAATADNTINRLAESVIGSASVRLFGPSSVGQAVTSVYYDEDAFIARQLGSEEKMRGLGAAYWHVGCMSHAASRAMLKPNSEGEARVGRMHATDIGGGYVSLRCSCCQASREAFTKHETVAPCASTIAGCAPECHEGNRCSDGKAPQTITVRSDRGQGRDHARYWHVGCGFRPGTDVTSMRVAFTDQVRDSIGLECMGCLTRVLYDLNGGVDADMQCEVIAPSSS